MVLCWESGERCPGGMLPRKLPCIPFLYPGVSKVAKKERKFNLFNSANNHGRGTGHGISRVVLPNVLCVLRNSVPKLPLHPKTFKTCLMFFFYYLFCFCLFFCCCFFNRSRFRPQNYSSQPCCKVTSSE